MQHRFDNTINKLRPFLETTDPATDDEEEYPFSHSVFDEEGKRAPFEPTGNRKLDAIVKAANPVFYYGAAPANVWPSDSKIVDGVIDGSRGRIDMPHRKQFRSDADYRSTLAHELVHWTKAKGRAERPHAGRDGWAQLLGIVPDGYPREEMVAEIGAAILLDYCGVKQDLKARAAYVNNWGTAIADHHERANAIDWAIDKAQEAVDYLLSLSP